MPPAPLDIAGARQRDRDGLELPTAISRTYVDAHNDRRALLYELELKDADIAECVQMLRYYANDCEECDGCGEIQVNDDRAESCPSCLEIWALITRLSPTPPPVEPVPRETVIEELDDDIPF